MFPGATKKSGGSCIVFPDVCKVPAPPAPPIPIPYPNSQLQANLKQANETDAKVQSGDKAAMKKQAKAIKNAKKLTGIDVVSATQAVLIGKTVHGKYVGKILPRPIRR